jgi:hypothetical protein
MRMPRRPTPTTAGDRRGLRGGTDRRGRRAGRPGTDRARLPRPRAGAGSRPRWSSTRSGIGVGTGASRCHPRRPQRISRVGEHDPGLGEHPSHAIRTGTGTYSPNPRCPAGEPDGAAPVSGPEPCAYVACRPSDARFIPGLARPEFHGSPTGTSWSWDSRENVVQGAVEDFPEVFLRLFAARTSESLSWQSGDGAVVAPTGFLVVQTGRAGGCLCPSFHSTASVPVPGGKTFPLSPPQATLRQCHRHHVRPRPSRRPQS